jgi:hypothetical protein|tara:strand:- start:118 stop:375 length:258 start_codon:yes stop_codon:yes gene_type:complete
LAITTLGYVYFSPSLLYRMTTVWRESFDGSDRLVCNLSHCDTARPYCSSVDVNCAGTALLNTTSVLGAVELKVITERPQQRGFWI